MARTVVLIVLVASVVIAAAFGRPPAPVPASAPPTEFSAERAMRTIARVAARPHRMGSAAHAEVERFLVRELEGLGLRPEIQETTVLQQRYAAPPFNHPPHFATVRNVIARARGRAPIGKALLLLAHYDSQSTTPGASDDGLGVATLIETARALLAGPPLERDVIFLFTDGEELGLLGAKAFVEKHPWADDVGLVLNFEARGNAGPVWMFQTSAENGALVEALAESVDTPIASSLSQAVYRHMPNDTDLSEWLPRGVAAMNFANLEGIERYHASTDTPGNLDVRTLQHHGTYALALASRFARGPLPPRAPDAVFFDAGPLFVRYPARATPWLSAAVAIAVALFLGAARWRRVLSWRGTLASSGLALVGPAVAALACAGVWGLAREVHVDLVIAIAPAIKELYFAGFVALAFGLAAIASAVGPRLTLAERTAGGLLVWTGLGAAAAFLLPGGAYLMQWPALIVALAGAALLAVRRFDGAHAIPVLVHALVAAPVIVVVAPVVRQVYVVFGPRGAAVVGLLVALLTVLLAPAVGILLTPQKRTTPLTALGIAVLAFAAAQIVPTFDYAYPRPDTLFFAVDEDRNAAFWVSSDPEPDAYTSQKLSCPSRTPLESFFPEGAGKDFIVSDAAPVELGHSELRVDSDQRDGAARVLGLRLVPVPEAELVAVYVAPDAQIVSARVQGEEVALRPDGSLSFHYFAPPPTGFTMSLRFANASQVPVRVVTQRSGWPPGVTPPGPRPQGFMPKPSVLPPYTELADSDMTVLTESFVR